ncbi:hypothetical protein D3C79_946390 [compost metagenome]
MRTAFTQALDGGAQQLFFIRHAVQQDQAGQTAKRLAHGTDGTVIGIARQARGEVTHAAGIVLQCTTAQRAAPGQ